MTFRDYLSRRITETGAADETGAPLPVARAENKLASLAMNQNPPLIERSRTWKEDRVGVRDAAKVQDELERLWRSEPRWLHAATEEYLAEKVRLADQAWAKV